MSEGSEHVLHLLDEAESLTKDPGYGAYLLLAAAACLSGDREQFLRYAAEAWADVSTPGMRPRLGPTSAPKRGKCNDHDI